MTPSVNDGANAAYGWSIRSVLVSVSDLDRSATFYQAVMNIREVLREDRLVILTGDETGSFTLFLREAHRNATHPGQQALGVRSLACNVGGIPELDRIEERLRSLDAFRDRLRYSEEFEVVRGHDPDRLSLTFVANELGIMSLADYHAAMTTMYSVDL